LKDKFVVVVQAAAYQYHCVTPWIKLVGIPEHGDGKIPIRIIDILS
jgi:hypothetical protein